MAAVNAEGAQVVTVTRGPTIPLGGLSPPVLHPASRTGDDNVDSLVVRLTCGAVEVLFTGDAEVPSEQSMLAAGVLTDVDVLKVGHHGSSSSTSQASEAWVRRHLRRARQPVRPSRSGGRRAAAGSRGAAALHRHHLRRRLRGYDE